MGDTAARGDATAARIHVPGPAECPPLTLIVGPCRSGTTALLRSTAAVGHPSYFQPIKQLIRGGLAGESPEFTIAPGDSPIVLKETFGPFVAEEVVFDPVEMLLTRGYPPRRLNVIATFRHPVDTYLSWKRMVSANPTFPVLDTGVFVAAFAHTEAVYERARANGITATAFVVDGCPHLDPRDVLRRLFTRHGLVYTDDAVEWGSDKLDSLIHKEPAPALFRAPGALHAVRTSKSYRLEGPRHAGSLPGTPGDVVDLIAEYERLLIQSAVDVGHPA